MCGHRADLVGCQRVCFTVVRKRALTCEGHPAGSLPLPGPARPAKRPRACRGCHAPLRASHSSTRRDTTVQWTRSPGQHRASRVCPARRAPPGRRPASPTLRPGRPTRAAGRARGPQGVLSAGSAPPTESLVLTSSDDLKARVPPTAAPGTQRASSSAAARPRARSSDVTASPSLRPPPRGPEVVVQPCFPSPTIPCALSFQLGLA